VPKDAADAFGELIFCWKQTDHQIRLVRQIKKVSRVNEHAFGDEIDHEIFFTAD
jgi:hypothetical protein